MWIDFFEMIFASQWILIPFCITEQCRLDYGKHCSIHQTLSPQAFSYTLNPWCVKIKGSPLAISLDSLEWNSEPTLHQIEVVSIYKQKKFTQSYLCKSPFDPSGKFNLCFMDPKTSWFFKDSLHCSYSKLGMQLVTIVAICTWSLNWFVLWKWNSFLFGPCFD
jgi:hypothetical protein